MRRRLLFVSIIFIALRFIARAQGAQHPSPSPAFPYSFSNAVWWNDAEIRNELKRRIPGLGDTIHRNSSQEAAIRTALSAMLRTKGIHAEVQSIEPNVDSFKYQRDPDAPLPSIAFSITEPPHILVEKLVLDSPPQELVPTLTETARDFKNKTYDANDFWFQQHQTIRPLRDNGYLTAIAIFTPGTPTKQAPNTYLVPITVTFDTGPQYHVAFIKADGGPLAKGFDLSRYFAVHDGDVAQPDPFGRLEGTLRGTYSKQGYVDLTIHDAPVLDKEHALVSYSLTVNPGPQYHFSTLNVQHLSASQEALIRDHFNLKKGDVFNESAITNLYHDVLPLKEFEGLSFSFKSDKNAKEGTVDVTLDFFKK